MLSLKMAKKSVKELNKEPSDIDGKLINMPVAVWDAVQIDATRCRRNVTKQIEAILVAYFQLESVELDKNRLNFARKAEKAITNGNRDAISIMREAAGSGDKK